MVGTGSKGWGVKEEGIGTMCLPTHLHVALDNVQRANGCVGEAAGEHACNHALEVVRVVVRDGPGEARVPLSGIPCGGRTSQHMGQGARAYMTVCMCLGVGGWDEGDGPGGGLKE